MIDTFDFFQVFSLKSFGIFAIFSFVLFIFVVWSEGRRDGFNENKLFDLILTATLSSFLISRIFCVISVKFGAARGIEIAYCPNNLNFYAFLIAFLLCLTVFSKIWKWSLYRILDIFSLGFLVSISIIFLGYVSLQQKFFYLFFFSGALILFAIFSALRNKKLKSGDVFSIILLIVVLFSCIVRASVGLPFYVLLITLSCVVFCFRRGGLIGLYNIVKPLFTGKKAKSVVSADEAVSAASAEKEPK
jgi:hypothetical protein